jgi:hypothetical protein
LFERSQPGVQPVETGRFRAPGGSTHASAKAGQAPRPIVDLLVVDRADHPILIGETKSRPVSEPVALAQLEAYIALADLKVPFVMIADPERIKIFRGGEGLKEPPIFSADTGPILGYYSSYFGGSQAGRFSEDFFLDLVLSWLRDLSYRWKSKSAPPPAFEELDRLGLVRHLKGAIFESGVPFGGYRLSRDESPDRSDSWTGA